jgi:hypothetical protein
MQLRPLRRYTQPDLTNDVVHFTGRSSASVNSEVPESIRVMTAEQRFLTILGSCSFQGFPVYGNRSEDRVVCFSEATPAGLEEMVQTRYEPWGIGFSKDSMLKWGGGPALYVRGDEFDAVRQALLPPTRARLTRFWPGAIPEGEERFSDSVKTPSEWAYEREWRVPTASLAFQIRDIRSLLVPTASLNDATITAISAACGVAANQVVPISDAGAIVFLELRLPPD